MNWLQRLSRKPAPSHWPERLAAYPPYRTPWPGPGAQLSLPQAEANLAHLLAERPARIDAIARLLQDWRIDVKAGLMADDPMPLLKAIDGWAHAEWPALHRAVQPRAGAWLRSRREGDEVVYALLLDLAIALGEVVRTRRPAYRWALDLDPGNAEMTSFRRPVLRVPGGGIEGVDVVLDVEALVCQRFEQALLPTFGLLDELSHGIGQALRGAHERPADGAG